MAEKQSTGAQAQLEDQYVTAIVVTHDGVTWLSEVVASLSAQKHQIDQIIAVDTGSIDGSVKLLTNAGIEVIKKSRSTGFGEAVASAVSKLPPAAIDTNEQEWLWILHDDCAPDRYALAKLLDAVISRPQVGIAGPKISAKQLRLRALLKRFQKALAVLQAARANLLSCIAKVKLKSLTHR